MLEFKVDSQQKSARVELLLKGEHEPIVLNVQRYDLIAEPFGTFLVIAQASASREWVTAVLEQFVCGKRIPVPENYVKLLKLVA